MSHVRSTPTSTHFPCASWIYMAHRGSDFEVVSLSSSPLQDKWSSTRVTQSAISRCFCLCLTANHQTMKSAHCLSADFSYVVDVEHCEEYNLVAWRSPENVWVFANTRLIVRAKQHFSLTNSPTLLFGILLGWRLGQSSAKCLLGCGAWRSFPAKYPQNKRDHTLFFGPLS